MGTLQEWWDEWVLFIEDMKADPKTALQELLKDNLAVVVPIVGLIVGIALLKLTRRRG